MMALEDRCSPQSAPSPPGIPHSPQSTTSQSILDMSLHGERIHKILNSDCTTDLIPVCDHRMSPPIRNDDRFSVEDIQIKEEENDSIIDDQDQNQERISVRQPQIPLINFSITNILSDRFGTNKSCMAKKKATATIFRPFEITRTSSQPVERSAFTRLTPEVIDYSRSPPNVVNAGNPLIIDRANFLNCFNAAAYPRIHEEILNSNRNRYAKQHDIAKMPPLGSLCKTVSQIGQQSHCLASSPPASSISSASSSSAPSPACRVPMSSSPQPIPPQSMSSRDSGMESSDDTRSESGSTKDDNGQQLWPAWVYCTRYSDRPSSGPRYRRPKQLKDKSQADEKRPRTAFSSDQLARLKREFIENRYLTERRRQQLSSELGLNEAQIKIWFQNKRAKIKKSSGTKNPLALQLMAQGLYNHTTVPLTKEEEELEMRMNGQL